MSSTWIRAEIALRTAIRRVTAAGGTPAASSTLAAMAAAFQVAAVAWGAFGSPGRAVHLRGSWAYGIVALVVGCDAALSVARFAPPAWAAIVRPRGRDRLRAVRVSLLSLAYAAAAAALLASWASHGATRIRLAVGERYGEPEQVVGVDWLRGSRPLAPRIEIAVEGVDVVDRADGSRSARSAVIDLGDRGRTVVRSWWPAWLGATELAFVADAGMAPWFELRDGRGGVLESGYAKLDVFPPGRRDVLTFERIPHRAYVEVRRAASGDLRWIVDAYRGKLPVASGTLGRDEPLAFEGIRLSLREGVPTVTLSIVRDRGLPFALGALLLAALSVALHALEQGRRRIEPPEGEEP
jgi:hypothetical protein